MSPEEELNDALSGRYRAIVIAQKDVDLRRAGEPNRMFVMKISEGSLAAGGRGGGFGERKVVRVSRYVNGTGGWERTFDTEDEGRLSGFEVPYHVSRIPMVLADGTESMGYGVVDPALVEEFEKKAS